MQTERPAGIVNRLLCKKNVFKWFQFWTVWLRKRNSCKNGAFMKFEGKTLEVENFCDWPNT